MKKKSKRISWSNSWRKRSKNSRRNTKDDFGVNPAKVLGIIQKELLDEYQKEILHEPRNSWKKSWNELLKPGADLV